MDKSDRSALFPSKLSVAAMFIASAILFSLINYEQIGALLLGEGGNEGVKEEVLPVVQYYLFKMLSIVTANAASFIFWIGIAYIGIVTLDFLRWLFYLYRKEIPSKKLTNSRVPVQGKKDIVVHLIIRSIALSGLVLWAIFFFIGVLPQTSAMFSQGLVLNLEILKLPAACGIFSGYIYVGSLLLKFLTLRKHLLE